MFPFGVLMGLDPVASAPSGRAAGGGPGGLSRGRAAGGAAGAPGGAGAGHGAAALGSVGVAPEVQAEVHHLWGRLPSALPMLLVAAQRGFLQASEQPRAVLVTTLVANAVNLPASWLFAKGDAGLQAFGLPAAGLGAGLGVLGIGVASSLVGALQALLLGFAARRVPGPAGRISLAGLRRLLHFGWPVGGAFFLEAGLFSTVTVLAGGFGTTATGAHQVALQVASFTFTVCLGLSAAAAVRTGHAIGRGDRPGARRASVAALELALAFMGTTALAFVLIPGPIARAMSPDPAVVEAAIPLLRIAGFFQLFDGLQATAAGALRGRGDTRITLVWAVVGHWGIGLPVGLALAWPLGLGVAGLWWGLLAALFVAAVSLVGRLLRAA
ncbi:MAG: MATE family efflux transporter [bacterium]